MTLLVTAGMMQHWIYDRPAENGVQFEAPLQELKDKIAVRATAVYCRLLSNEIMFLSAVFI